MSHISYRDPIDMRGSAAATLLILAALLLLPLGYWTVIRLNRTVNRSFDSVKVFVLDSFVDETLVNTKPSEWELTPRVSHGAVTTAILRDHWHGEFDTIDVASAAGIVSVPRYLEGLRQVASFASRNPESRVLVNISLAGRVFDEQEQSLLAPLHALGVVIIASAGNDGNEEPRYPAALSNVLAIAALAGNRKSAYSNYGPFVDLAANGETLQIFDQNTLWSDYRTRINAFGTSCSAPRVTGALASLLARHPALRPQAAAELLRKAARPLPQDPLFTAGKLGAGALSLNRAFWLQSPLLQLALSGGGLAVLVLVIVLLFFLAFQSGHGFGSLSSDSPLLLALGIIAVLVVLPACLWVLSRIGLERTVIWFGLPPLILALVIGTFRLAGAANQRNTNRILRQLQAAVTALPPDEAVALLLSFDRVPDRDIDRRIRELLQVPARGYAFLRHLEVPGITPEKRAALRIFDGLLPPPCNAPTEAGLALNWLATHTCVASIQAKPGEWIRFEVPDRNGKRYPIAFEGTLKMGERIVRFLVSDFIPPMVIQGFEARLIAEGVERRITLTQGPDSSFSPPSCDAECPPFRVQVTASEQSFTLDFFLSDFSAGPCLRK